MAEQHVDIAMIEFDDIMFIIAEISYMHLYTYDGWAWYKYKKKKTKNLI